MNPLLTEDINKELSTLPVEWAVIDGVHLEKVFEFNGFAAAMDFVNKVGEVADKSNHHPDILLHDYKKVTIKTTTHDTGGLTKKDFEIAKLIEGKLK